MYLWAKVKQLPGKRRKSNRSKVKLLLWLYTCEIGGTAPQRLNNRTLATLIPGRGLPVHNRGGLGEHTELSLLLPQIKPCLLLRHDTELACSYYTRASQRSRHAIYMKVN
jgi:hypothetical protein